MSFEFLRNKDVFKFSFYIVIFEGARIKKKYSNSKLYSQETPLS